MDIDRMIKIAELKSRNLSSHEIAGMLQISERTVDRDLSKIHELENLYTPNHIKEKMVERLSQLSDSLYKEYMDNPDNSEKQERYIQSCKILSPLIKTHDNRPIDSIPLKYQIPERVSPVLSKLLHAVEDQIIKEHETAMSEDPDFVFEPIRKDELRKSYDL